MHTAATCSPQCTEIHKHAATLFFCTIRSYSPRTASFDKSHFEQLAGGGEVHTRRQACACSRQTAMQSRRVLARLPWVRRRIATPQLWAMLEPCVVQPQLLGGSGSAAVPYLRQYSSSVSVPQIKQELLDKLTSVKHGFVSRVDIDVLSARVRAALRFVCAAGVCGTTFHVVVRRRWSSSRASHFFCGECYGRGCATLIFPVQAMRVWLL